MMHRTDSGIAVTPERLGLKKEGGQPLPEGLRRRAEAVFDVDLAAVRVHQGFQPLWIDAIAFACGTDIYFAPGCYQPGTRQGQWLISHELAHVVQQCQGRVNGTAGAVLSLIDDATLEAEADAIAWAALQSPPLIAPHKHKRPLASPASSHIIIQPFWERLANGKTVWRDDHFWRANSYEYVTWIWPLWCLPRGVYRRRTITSPFGHTYDYDPTYSSFRSKINTKLDLDLDDAEAWQGTADNRIQSLFQKFSVQGWFCYDMQAHPYYHLGGNPSPGDCETLCDAFIIIAKNEFGLDVEKKKWSNAYLTNGEQTIDAGASGNCNNATYWFFDRHFWVSYNGTSYDLLFGKQRTPARNSTWISKSCTNDITTLNDGSKIRPNPDATSDPVAGHVKNAYLKE